MPAAPEEVAFEGHQGIEHRFGEFLQARCLRLVRRAFRERCLVIAPAQPRRDGSPGRDALWGAPIIYVHSKVSIFDDEAAIVSSANLNGRSLYWDTDLGVEFTETEDVAFDGAHSADARFGEFLQHRCVKLVRRAFGPRVLFMAPAQPRPSQTDGRDTLWGAPIVYVHAKVSIFDDDAAIVSSANLNGRSLYWDTELGVEIAMREDVERLRRRCFRHWLPEDAGEEFYRPETALSAWRRLAVENLHRAPAERRGFVLPYDPTPAERFGRDLAVPVPNEMV